MMQESGEMLDSCTGAHPRTDYAAYLSMFWTSPLDKCEGCDTVTMAEGRYVEGRFGHYCSCRCLLAAESYVPDDGNYEREQMGIDW